MHLLHTRYNNKCSLEAGAARGDLLSSWHLTPTLCALLLTLQSLTSREKLQSTSLSSIPVQLLLSMPTSGPPLPRRSMNFSVP